MSAPRQLLQLGLEEAHQLPLLALHAIGVVGVACEQREIEGRDRTGLAVAELPGRRLQPDLDHARHHLELVEQVRASAGGTSSRAAPSPVPGSAASTTAGMPRRPSAERGRQPHGARADDNDAVFVQ